MKQKFEDLKTEFMEEIAKNKEIAEKNAHDNDTCMTDIAGLMKFHKEMKPRMSEWDKLIEFKGTKKQDIKKSLIEYTNNGWLTNVGPKFMKSDEIEKMNETLQTHINLNFDKFRDLELDHKQMKNMIVWSDDFDNRLEEYATVNRVKILETLIVDMATSDALKEKTFALEQKINKLAKHSTETYATKSELTDNTFNLKTELWKTFVLNDNHNDFVKAIQKANEETQEKIKLID